MKQIKREDGSYADEADQARGWLIMLMKQIKREDGSSLATTNCQSVAGVASGWLIAGRQSTYTTCADGASGQPIPCQRQPLFTQSSYAVIASTLWDSHSD